MALLQGAQGERKAALGGCRGGLKDCAGLRTNGGWLYHQSAKALDLNNQGPAQQLVPRSRMMIASGKEHLQKAGAEEAAVRDWTSCAHEAQRWVSVIILKNAAMLLNPK